MKKLIIGSLVSAFILFAYSFASWVFLPTHAHSFKYSKGQDSILKVMDQYMTEDGAYMMPILDNTNVKAFDMEYKKACEEYQKTCIGRPFAMVFFTKKMGDMDPMMMVIGFLIYLIGSMIVCIFIGAAKHTLTTTFQRWWLVMLLACFICVVVYWSEANWMSMPWHYLQGMVIDTIVGWGLAGFWLSWYLGRPEKK